MRIGSGQDISADHFIGTILKFQIFHGNNVGTESSGICALRYGVVVLFDVPSNQQLKTYSCLDCEGTGGNFLTRDNECLSTCNPGTSGVTMNAVQICRECAFNCESCTGRKPNQCSTCTVGNLNTTSDVNCPDLPSCSFNQYFENNDCITCASPCLTCEVSSTRCTSCDNSTYYNRDFDCQSQVCGDGVIVEGESCDDGNLANTDGCSSVCQLETGFYCPAANQACSSVCGDGIRASNEGCDDGNVVDGDGCSGSCKTEKGYYCTLPVDSNPNAFDTCTTCPVNCAACANATVCTECQAGNYFQGTMCGTCNSDQYLKDSSRCSDCPVGCSTCTSDEVCTACSSPYFLEGDDCIITCGRGEIWRLGR